MHFDYIYITYIPTPTPSGTEGAAVITALVPAAFKPCQHEASSHTDLIKWSSLECVCVYALCNMKTTTICKTGQ